MLSESAIVVVLLIGCLGNSDGNHPVAVLVKGGYDRNPTRPGTLLAAAAAAAVAAATVPSPPARLDGQEELSGLGFGLAAVGAGPHGGERTPIYDCTMTDP